MAACHGQEVTFRSTVPLVVAPVTVTDREGHPVDGLTEGDFQVLDNGTPRKIDGEILIEPLALVVAVQTSEGSAAALTKIRRIGSMIQPLITGNRGSAAVLAFDEEIRLVREFTSSEDDISAAFSSLRPRRGRPRLLDAVDRAVRMLREGPPRHRRVILLLGEDKDGNSESGLPEVLTAAQRENISIYAVTYSPVLTGMTVKSHELPPSGGMNLLALFSHLAHHGKQNAAETLTGYTGGRRLRFVTQNALEEAVSAIGEELHSQYLLSFSPPPETAAGYRSIEVRLPGRPDAQVRTRPGYWLAEP
jgi:VWFA-related protein